MESQEEHPDYLRIVTINSHQPYLHLLAGLPHRFTVIDRGLPGRFCRWDSRVRPLPPRYRLTSYQAALTGAAGEPFDVALAHNLSDLLVLQDFSHHRILLLHTGLERQLAHEDGQLSPKAFVDRVGAFLRIVSATVVYVSEVQARSWGGIPGLVIRHGICPGDYGGYTGRHPAVLRVTGLAKQLRILLRDSVQREVLHGIPSSLVDYDPGVPGARRIMSWQQLQAVYRDHRCLLSLRDPERDDGYNLVLLEAMATGMPVVSTAHPASPVRDGHNGLVGETTSELRRHLVRLLHQRELAHQLGENARRTIMDSFPYDTFLAAWHRLLANSDCQEDSALAAARRGAKTVSAASVRAARVAEDIGGRPSRVRHPFPPRLTVIPGGRRP